MVNDYLVGRSFNVLYIWIDAILLLAFLYVLARTRRRPATGNLAVIQLRHYEYGVDVAMV